MTLLAKALLDYLYDATCDVLPLVTGLFTQCCKGRVSAGLAYQQIIASHQEKVKNKED